LTEILNAFFGRAVAKIEAHGGDVARFAGDALLAIWPCNAEEELPLAIRSAAACALDLQTPQSGDGEETESPLTMKVALGAGSLVAMHLGGHLDRWEFLISGGAFQQAFAALRQTQSGTATASLQAWKSLQQQYRATPMTGGVMMLESGPREPQGPPLNPVPVSEEMTEALRSYVPAAVIDRLATGHGGWLAELRLVTTLFVSLPELNYATPLDRAQAVMHYLQRELYRYEGAVNKLNVDEKGAALLAAFGLPPLAHEDDGRRGVAAALAMQRRLRELGFDVSVGVSTGRAYCGVFGGERRREYTLLGDTVNRAARLMQAAVGDILCDEGTRQAAERQFQFEPLPHVLLKGKSAPLAVFRPVAAEARTAAAQGALVGREAELSMLMEALQTAVAAGTSRTVLIEGEAGVGKSRLLAEWLARAELQQAACLLGHADALETTTLYFAWRPVFERLLGVDVGMSAADASRRLAARLAELPEFADWAPLLRAVLPADLPDNDLTSHMTGRVRGENTRRLLAALLEQEARRRPEVIVLDDVHWLDSASWELAEFVSHVSAPVLLVLGSRPLSDPLSPPLAKILAAPHASRIALGPLSPEESVQLACRRLGVESLPPRVVDLKLQRPEG
jgi:class 3 adenylate cyclase